MKLVVTGGHITPALAVIEALPRGADVVFVGRKHTFESDSAVSFEYEVITKQGIPFRVLPSARLQRSISRHTLPSLVRLPKSVAAARKILIEEKPDVVLSFGGYIGLPVVLAAKSLGIRSVIHEQTTRAGFANKFCSRFATKVCISWESSREFFPKEKTILTGNPLRSEVLALPPGKVKRSASPMIYVTGGSGGSHFLNALVEKNLVELLKKARIIHQTGNAKEFNDFERLSRFRESLPETLRSRYEVKQFLFSEEASGTIASADLVVGRSGINTISELIYFEKPALCIPLPTGQKGEQQENATLLATLGLGRVLLQSRAEDLFLSQVTEMLADLSAFSLNDPSLRELFIHAAENVVAVLTNVAN